MAQAIPRTPRPPDADGAQTPAQRLGPLGVIVLFGGGLPTVIACAAVAIVLISR